MVFMGGFTSRVKKITSIRSGLMFRIKTIFNQQKDRRLKYRIKKRYVRYLLFGVKSSLLFLFWIISNRIIHKDLKSLDVKYDEIILNFNKLKGKKQLKYNNNFEKFYRDLINNKLDNSNTLRFVELKQNDRASIFYEKLIHFIMKANNMDMRFDLRIVKYFSNEKMNQKIYDLAMKEIDQICFGISRYGGIMILNENIISSKCKDKLAELFFIVVLNMDLAFKFDISENLRLYNIDYLIKIANLSKHDRKFCC